MTDLKFCCDRFKNYYECDMEENVHRVPSIKIIKCKAEYFVISPAWDKLLGIRGNLRFCILTGLDEKRKTLNSVPIFIKYCPFCGKWLNKFYKDEIYVNEVEEEPFAFLDSLMKQELWRVNINPDV